VNADVVTGDGCRLWVDRSGTGEPLVLCHGGPGLWDVFGDLAAALADVATVFRWDQRGGGRSDHRGPYTLDRFVADLDAVRGMSGRDRVALLGHSWGAQLALAYTLRYPERVSRLVYVSGVGLGSDWRPEFHRNADERLGPRRARFARLRAAERTPEQDRELAVLQWSIDFVDAGRALGWAQAMATPWYGINYECNRALGAELAQTWREPDLVAACRRLPVPTLIIDGAADLRPRWAVDSLAAALPAVTRVVLDRVGHLPWIEAPSEFGAAVRGFLAEPTR
jgi:proline iminopeptidase